MKLEQLNITAYQGISHLALDFDAPIILACGKNATGKTTLKDAVELAMTGASGRVKHKKDYASLVRLGSDPKTSAISLTVDGFTFSRKVASGKAGHEERDYAIVLPHLLGSSRFALLPHTEQSRLLFAVTGVKRDAKTIKAMMEERGIEPECIEEAMPMLRAGFAAAVKSCKDQQSAARGGWEAVTEERFGEAKAQNWVATEFSGGEGINLEACKSAAEQIAAAIPDSKARLQGAMEQLAEVRAEMRQAAFDAELQCPSCQAALLMKAGTLVNAAEGVSEEELATLKANEAKLVQTVKGCESELEKLEQEHGSLRIQITAYQNAQADTTRRTTKAKELLKRYTNWKAAADSLSPTGIPLALLEKGLQPINDRLVETCKVTGWPTIRIHADLSISYGDIGYSLLSESEQWRVDAAIAECLSLLSNVKLFVLDRMDVLHPHDRSTLLKWLIKVAPDHDSILVLATLKEAPKNLPPAIQTVWMARDSEKMEAAA